MNTEKQAAETLLDKGIKVRVSAPLLLRLIGIRKLRPVMRQPFLGTLHRISLIYLNSGMTADELANVSETNAHELYRRYAMPLAEIMAQALLNGRIRGRLFGKVLAKWLAEHVQPIDLMLMANVLVGLNSKQAFTNTIRLVSTMTTTAPNLSQTNQGS
jgi:hypothetical protein